MSIISDLANKIVDFEFDGDTSVVNSTTISGWIHSHLGELNTLLNTSYSGANAELDLESQSIVTEMYLSSYYTREARNAARGIIQNTAGQGDILELQDGNSKVKFTNKNEVSKVYRGLATDAQVRLDQLVAKYTIHQAQPLQVGGIESATGACYE
jgi:hypothetical protein